MIKRILDRVTKKNRYNVESRTWYIPMVSLIRSDNCANWELIVWSVAKNNLDFNIKFCIEQDGVITRCHNKPDNIDSFGIIWRKYG